MVSKQIKTIIAEVSGYGTEKDISMGLTFFEDLDMDDYNFSELLETLEEEFDVELTQNASRFEIVKDLIDYIQDNL